MKLKIEDTKIQIYKTLCEINYPMRLIGLRENSIMGIRECDLSKIKKLTEKEFVAIVTNMFRVFHVVEKDKHYINFSCYINASNHTFEIQLRYRLRLNFFVKSNLHDFYKGRYLNEALTELEKLINEKNINNI